MNRTTALFLSELGGALNDNSLFQLLWRELRRMHQETFSTYAQNLGLVWYSDEAKALKKSIDELEREISLISDPSRATVWLDRFFRRREQRNTLLARTEQALQQKGVIPFSEVHLLWLDAEKRYRARIERYVRIQTFRLLVLSDHDPAIPPPHGSDLASLIEYYRLKLAPKLEALSDEELYHQWAVEYDPQASFGGLFRLPSFRLSGADQTRNDLLPGQYAEHRKEMVWKYQGRGRITNVTPEQVFEAIRSGCQNTLSLSALERRYDRMTDPVQCLTECFDGGYYAVDPYSYFSMVSFLMEKHAIRHRLLCRACICCGNLLLDEKAGDAAQGAVLCRNCKNKMRKKIEDQFT